MFQEAIRLLQDREGITNLEKNIIGVGLLALFLLFACGLLWAPQ